MFRFFINLYIRNQHNFKDIIKKETKIKKYEIIIKMNTNIEKMEEKKKTKSLVFNKEYYYDNNYYDIYSLFSEKSKNRKNYEIILKLHKIDKGIYLVF